MQSAAQYASATQAAHIVHQGVSTTHSSALADCAAFFSQCTVKVPFSFLLQCWLPLRRNQVHCLFSCAAAVAAGGAVAVSLQECSHAVLRHKQQAAYAAAAELGCRIVTAEWVLLSALRQQLQPQVGHTPRHAAASVLDNDTKQRVPPNKEVL
jgi:hypothetical protein